jgi:hypothetical protein
MGHQVHFEIAGGRILPIAEGAYRNGVAQKAADPDLSPPGLTRMTHRGKEPIERGRAHRQ